MSSEEPTFDPHDVRWTRAKSARFWDYQSSRPETRALYFSRLVGDTLVKLVLASGVALKGRVLDFGSGPGFLLECLLRAGVECEGADFSASSVRDLQERLRDDSGFRGAHHLEKLPSGLPSGGFDAVFFVETIEHLLDGDLEATISELHRLLKPGGTLIVTTPNDEDLGRSQAVCPDCGGRFHVMQHVRRWNEQSLTTYLAARGFRHRLTRKLWLRRTRAATLAFSMAVRVLRRKPPNLVWIGTRA